MKKNVLKSLMFICLSLITAIVFTSARATYEPPGPPGKPEVVNVDRDRCTVQYRAPQYDGGMPILNYSVEYKYESSDRWLLASNRVDPKDLQFTVTGLIEGSKLQFRVRAYNIAGWGVPSKESDMIKIESPF